VAFIFLVMMRSRVMHHVMPVMVMNHPAVMHGATVRLRHRKTCHSNQKGCCQ
jgi:hypothetical protein